MHTRLACCFGFLIFALVASGEEHTGMSWLDNGQVRVGIDLRIGGAITWISKSEDRRNVINSADWGRQVQMSYYSGPIPFIVGNKHPREFWKGLGWNPIQAGDDFGHGSRVMDHSNDGRAIHVRCRPMQWPLDDVPGECFFDSWLELDGNVLKAQCRLTNSREDRTRYPARSQELPAIYTNGWLHKIVSYTGDQPFTQAPVTVVPPKGPVEGWTSWSATEYWSALTDNDNWGLGVWTPATARHIGGFNGKPGPSGEHDGACGYIAPIRSEIIDHNIVHDYSYELILGTVEEIRAHALKRRSNTPPAWDFTNSRAGWYYEGAHDQGWPITGEVTVTNEIDDARILSPEFACRAETIPTIMIQAAFSGPDDTAEIFWATSDNPHFAAARSARFPVVGDGQVRPYRVPLIDKSGYTGLITRLRLDPSNKRDTITKLTKIAFEPPTNFQSQ